MRTNIRIYLVVKKSRNKYPNIFVLGKWHKYKYKLYLRALLFEYLNTQIFVLSTAVTLLRFIALSHCETFTLSFCYTITISHFYSVIIYWHTATLSYFHSNSLSHCYNVTLSHCLNVTLSYVHATTLRYKCHTVTFSNSSGLEHSNTITLSHYHSVIQSLCHTVTQPHSHMSHSHIVILWHILHILLHFPAARLFHLKFVLLATTTICSWNHNIIKCCVVLCVKRVLHGFLYCHWPFSPDLEKTILLHDIGLCKKNLHAKLRKNKNKLGQFRKKMHLQIAKIVN